MITEIDRIYDLDLIQLWNRLKMEDECDKECCKHGGLNKAKEAVKWGFLVPRIEIHELINIRPKGKIGKYLYKNRVFTSEQIWQEVDNREIAGKRFLLDHYGGNELAEARKI